MRRSARKRSPGTSNEEDNKRFRLYTSSPSDRSDTDTPRTPFPIDELPIDITKLVLAYIPARARLLVLGALSKRWMKIARESITTLSEIHEERIPAALRAYLPSLISPPSCRALRSRYCRIALAFAILRCVTIESGTQCSLMSWPLVFRS